MCFSSCNDDLRSMHNGTERELFATPYSTYLYIVKKNERMDGLEIELVFGARELCHLRKAFLAIMKPRNLLQAEEETDAEAAHVSQIIQVFHLPPTGPGNTPFSD